MSLEPATSILCDGGLSPTYFLGTPRQIGRPFVLFRNAQLGPRRNEKQIKTLYISGGYNCRVERGSVFLGLLHKLLCKSTRMERGRRMYKYIMKERKKELIGKQRLFSSFFWKREKLIFAYLFVSLVTIVRDKF